MKKISLCLCGLILAGSSAVFGQQTITFPYNSGPYALDISLEAQIAVVVNRYANTASVVKLADYTMKTISLDKDANGNTFKDSKGTVLTALAPISVALFAGGTKAIVTNFGSNTVSILDTADPVNPKVTAIVPVGAGPRDVVVATKHNMALVCNLNGNSVSFVDLTTNTDPLTQPIPVGNSPISIAYDPDNDRAYVVNYQPDSTNFNKISVIDVTSRINFASIQLTFGSQPVDIAISTATKKAVVVNSGGNSVSILDLTQGTESATVNIGAGSRPFSVAINPKTNYAAILSNGTKTINLINLADPALGDSSKLKTVAYEISSNPTALALNPDKNTALVVDPTESVMMVTYLGFTNYLPFAIDTADFRSNLALNNLSATEANMTISLYDKDGNQLAHGDVKVPANGLKQINDINRYLKGVSTLTTTFGALTVNSDQPFTSFISVIDNATNDPSLQVGRTSGYTKLLVNAVTNVGSYRSRLFVQNLGSLTGSISLTATDIATGAVIGTKTGISIPKNGFYYTADVLADMGVTGRYGPLQIDSVTFSPVFAVTLVGSTAHTNGFMEAIPIQ